MLTKKEKIMVALMLVAIAVLGIVIVMRIIEIREAYIAQQQTQLIVDGLVRLFGSDNINIR